MTLAIRKILEKRCTEKYIPFAVVFELTYWCNLACKHCYTVNNGKKELTFEEIAFILDQLVETGTFYLCLTGGEIFMRKDFFDIAWYAKKMGFFLILLTNGTLLTDKDIKEIGKLKPRGIEISLLGANSSTHDSITNSPGSFEKTIRSIKGLAETGIRITTKTTLLNLNAREYSQIKYLAGSLGAHPRIGSVVIPKINGSREPKRFQISQKEKLSYLSEEEADNDNEIILSEKDENPYKNLTCKAGKAVASISPYGDVQPCILMPIKLGNLRDRTFKEIWYPRNSYILNRIRSISVTDLKICSKCKLAGFCTRCPGETYLETGSLLEPSSSACEDAMWKAYHYGNNEDSISPACQVLRC